jgi:MFS family permease
MPGGGVVPVSGTTDVDRVEAPVTFRAYLIIAFAAFGGIFFGYDTGWMGGVLNMPYFIKQYTGAEYPDIVFPGLDAKDPKILAYRKEFFSVTPGDVSLVTSILSAGTFFGAIAAGDIADFIGRRTTIIIGCLIFTIGGILETVSVSCVLVVSSLVSVSVSSPPLSSCTCPRLRPRRSAVLSLPVRLE